MSLLRQVSYQLSPLLGLMACNLLLFRKLHNSRRYHLLSFRLRVAVPAHASIARLSGLLRSPSPGRSLERVVVGLAVVSAASLFPALTVPPSHRLAFRGIQALCITPKALPLAVAPRLAG